jgi:hypothetical protein
MTLQIEPKTTTRPDLLMIAGAAAATGGAAPALGSDAVAQTAGGRIKAIGFDAFTIFAPLSVGAVIDEYLLGNRLASHLLGRSRERAARGVGCEARRHGDVAP